MRIKFDPEHTDVDLCFLGSGSKSRTRSRSKSMRGGGFTKAQRCEYMDLCRQMTSRDPVQVTRANRDRLLAFLKAYVIEHSAEYPKKRKFIMETIPRLFENPAMLEDPNYLGSYNLVAFQCSILFTIVSMDMSPEEVQVCMLLQQLQRYELSIDVIKRKVNDNIPLSPSDRFIGFDPSLLDIIHPIVDKYITKSDTYHRYDSDKHIRHEVSTLLTYYPKLATVTNYDLEVLRHKCRRDASILDSMVREIATKYDIEKMYLADIKWCSFYFALLKANIWNDYIALRTIIMKRQMGLYVQTGTVHTEDMDIHATEDYSGELFLYHLYSTDLKESHPLYLITIISYLYIQEITNAIVHNIYYCGLAYKLQKADGQNHYPYHFLMHDYFHSYDSITLFKVASRLFFQKIYDLIMRTTFNKEIRYSILLVLFYNLHEDSTIVGYNAKKQMLTFRDSMDDSLEDFLISKERWYDLDDLGLSIPKAHRGSEESIDAYVTHSFKLFYEYFQAAKAMNDPLPNSAKLSGSAKKLLNLYVDKEVVVSTERLKRLLQTRKVAKRAAQKARKSKSRSHS